MENKKQLVEKLMCSKKKKKKTECQTADRDCQNQKHAEGETVIANNFVVEYHRGLSH